MCKTAFFTLLNFCPLPLICFYSRVAQVRAPSHLASEDFLGAGIETRRCRAGAEGCVLGVPCLHVHSSLKFWVWVCAAVESNMLCTFFFLLLSSKLLRMTYLAWDWVACLVCALKHQFSETAWSNWLLKLSFEMFWSSTICRLNFFL